LGVELIPYDREGRNEFYQRARYIQEIARCFAGKRLVVLAGSEHRYVLRELLAKSPEVELKEFYEVPGWTKTARWTHWNRGAADDEGGSANAGLRRSVCQEPLPGAAPVTFVISWWLLFT